MKKLIASIVVVAFIAVMSSGCTLRDSSVKASFSHSGAHNHRGVPRHHMGTYHKITRTHRHTHN